MDKVGNTTTLNQDNFEALGFTSEFEIINTQADTTAPVLHSYEASAYQFDVSNEDATFNISAHIIVY